MMIPIYTFAVFVLTIVLTGVVLRILKAKAIMDTPNARSNHTQPTPRGGGLAIALAVAIGWTFLAIYWYGGFGLYGLPMIVAGAAILLCAISWLDDVKPLGAGLRLAAHLAACIAGTWALGSEPVFQGLFPLWLDRILVVLLWAGFLNIFNFMDGIDGITSVQTAAIAMGLTVVTMAGQRTGFDTLTTLTLAAAAMGFLTWNKPPAKLFMGDVGSIPLGYILCWFVLLLAQSGAWVAALLLPSYYLADGGITLLRRALRKEKIWQAHKEHFYQRCVAERMDQWGQTRTVAHTRVSSGVAVANMALVGCAVYSLDAPWIALGLGVVIVAVLLAWMSR